jgi:hypothetical protein
MYYAQNDPLSKAEAVSRNRSRVQTVSVGKMANTCPIKYLPNGTGRDTYIYSNNGGFTI